ncbi:MAG TPA: guanylate kinase [Polyangiaceae bacterium LLY-WYZ-14_1]|nr:guanylate kinase [Polyangiaceae bacterium LLY-WYZ-14_1]
MADQSTDTGPAPSELGASQDGPVTSPRNPADALLLLILSSPSGAGKSTLTRRLLAEFPDFTFSVSHTTRPPRPGEVDGSHYHFVSRGTFDALVQERRFLEWAEVHGNLYGTALSEIEGARSQGLQGIVFDVDHQGARQMKATVPQAVGVFILPPSMAELERRLRRRAQDPDEVIARRFARAREEIAHYGSFDYLVVNEDLDEATAALLSIVRAERSRRIRRAHQAERLLRHGQV